jgi:hypothetical protein
MKWEELGEISLLFKAVPCNSFPYYLHKFIFNSSLSHSFKLLNPAPASTDGCESLGDSEG